MNTVYCSAFQKVIPPVHSCFCFQTVQPRWKAGTHLNPFSIRFWQAVRFSVTGRSNISPWPDNGLYYRDTRVFGWMLHVWVTVYLVFREKISLSVISYTQMQCSPKLNSDRSYVLHPLSSASRKASLLSYVTHRRRHHRHRVIEVWLVSSKTSVGIMMKLCRLLSVKNNSSAGKLQNACLVSGALWMSFCLGSKGEASWEPGYWR